MSKNFYFTITPGRSGTVYLAELLTLNAADSIVFHERFGFQNYGVVTPDASDFMLFNSVGNVEKIQKFWTRKFNLDLRFQQSNYIEISHFLSKAGLLENIDMLTDQNAQVHIILLKRDLFKNLWSYINHFDFTNMGFTWLFTLDLRYPNKIVDSSKFQPLGMLGAALWYLCEMAARAEYYKILYQDHKNITFHRINLEDIVSEQGAEELMKELGLKCKNPKVLVPGKRNETKIVHFEQLREPAEQLVKNLEFDPKQMAKNFIDSGRRLATPKQPVSQK